MINSTDFSRDSRDDDGETKFENAVPKILESFGTTKKTNFLKICSFKRINAAIGRGILYTWGEK